MQYHVFDYRQRSLQLKGPNMYSDNHRDGSLTRHKTLSCNNGHFEMSLHVITGAVHGAAHLLSYFPRFIRKHGLISSFPRVFAPEQFLN